MTSIALILAAGSGRRLGLGPKALLPWDDSVLVVRAVRAAVSAGLHPVVTAGPGFAEIERHLAEAVPSDSGDPVEPSTSPPPPASPCPPAPTVELVPVPDAATGMSASWRAGISAIDALAGTTSATAVAVMLVDQPGVGTEVLRRLVADFDPARVARAAWAGRPGHPVMMSLANARAAAAEATGDEAARTWMRANRHLVDQVECGDLGDGSDIDTIADLRSWRL